MPGGQSHGADRAYEEMCRDICIQRSAHSFQPYHGTDGIDVGFEAGGTTWSFDVALENTNGDLLVAECKRWADPVPQKEVAVIAHTVLALTRNRGNLNLPVVAQGRLARARLGLANWERGGLEHHQSSHAADEVWAGARTRHHR